MIEGLGIQITHTGTIKTSILLSDIDDGVDFVNSFRKAGPVYVRAPPAPPTSLLYTTTVALSFEVGALRGFIDSGLVTVNFVVGAALAAALPAGGGDLATTLTLGNATGGTNIDVSLGDALEFDSIVAIDIRPSRQAVMIGPGTGGDVSATSANVALGIDAGGNLSDSNAINNVMIGNQALAASTTGRRNVTVGAETMESGNGADDCVALGYRALRSVGADGNIGIGSRAGENITTGRDNVAIGDVVFANMTTGVENVVIGENAMFTAITGDRNVAIGERAGFSINGGTENTFLGTGAGETMTAGSRNIVVGSEIDPVSLTASDQINIGHAIQGNRATGQVLIGATTPTALTTSAKLEITGTNGALLLPRLTTAQRDALTPVDGMLLYNTSIGAVQARVSGVWVSL